MFDMILGMLGSGASSLGSAFGGSTGNGMPFGMQMGKPQGGDDKKQADPAGDLATAQPAQIPHAQRAPVDLQTLMTALQKRMALGTGGQ